MKILVTGSSGFLGLHVLEKGRQLHQVFGTSHNFDNPDLLKMDVSKEQDVNRVIASVEPDVVVHAAAMRNDAVERNHEEGFAVNVQGTRNLAEACKKRDIFLAYVSSDLVFDGNKGLYKEDDEPNPVSYFGCTKMLAEKSICEVGARYCVARTSMLYGWDRRSSNFAMTVIKNLRAKKEFEVVKDQFVTPSYVENIADMILEICKRQLEGTFHLAGKSRITRYDFALQIADIFLLDSSLLNPVSIDQLNWTTKRGKDCSLDVSLISQLLDTKPLSSLEGIRIMKSKENQYVQGAS